MFLDQGSSCQWSFRRNFKKGSLDLKIKGIILFLIVEFDWKLKGPVPFLAVERDWRAANPLARPQFSQRHPINIFEIDILFNINERSGNYVFEDDKRPRAFRAGVGNYALGEKDI